jgi:hypothetical protein
VFTLFTLGALLQNDLHMHDYGARGSAVVEALMLQAGRSRVDEFFFMLPNPSIRIRPWGLLSL